MHPSLFSTLTLSIITSFLLHIPISLCQHEQYVNCGELFHCGSLENVGYPFYGEWRPENCGRPGFELNCKNDVPFITIQSVKYRVLAIDHTTRALIVARDDLWSDLCPALLYNTTLDFNIFKYVPNYKNITLYYGCFSIPGQSSLLPNQFDCTVNNSTSFSFYLTRDALFSNYDSTVRCNDSIKVPVNLGGFTSLETVSASVGELRSALADGFGLEWLADNINCERCSESGGRCGHDSVTNSFVCYCADQSFSDICNNTQNETRGFEAPEHKYTLSIIIIISASLGMIVAPVLSITVIIYPRGRTCKINDENVEAFMSNWGSLAPKQYSYSEIKKITNSLREKLGQGGYGSVYKGKLPDGRLVAVKVLNETKGKGEDFINEVSSISKTSHVNVVSLLGFCYNKKRALIYEFMPNGSLDKFIYKYGECHLEWKTLYEITVGIARGLEYLHQGLNRRIVHFDIKPHNILLDQEFCPKISDFGLAKLSEKKESILSMSTARGTPGYIAPEVFLRHLGGVSHKSDVYSYGMMILEMVGVRKNVAQVVRSSEVYFPQWIYEHLELGKEIDMQDVTCEEEEEISRKMILVGLWCIQTNPSDRPSISRAVEMLEGSLHSLQIPPKPFLYSPKRSSQRLLSQDSFTSCSHISLGY